MTAPHVARWLGGLVASNSVSNSSRVSRLALAGLVTVAILVAWAMGRGRSSEDAPTPPEPVVATATTTTTTVAAERAEGYAAELARLEQRIAWLERRADQRADDWSVLEELAAAHMEHAQLTGDYESYRRAEGALERAFARAPEGAGPHLTRAQLSYSLHRFDRIEADLAAAERYRLPAATQARAIARMRANLARERGDYDASRAAFERLAAERRTPDVVLGLAQHAWQTGAYDEAATLLEEAERLGRGADPVARAHACLARGLLELDRGRLDDALGHYRRGLAHLPGFWLVEEHIAEVVAERGEHARARELYAELVDRTQNPELMDALADVLAALGDAPASAAMRARAHEGHEARLAILPEAAFGHALDHYLEHDGDMERAVELAERNRSLRPNGESLTSLAQAYVRAGRLEDAMAVVRTLRASAYRSAAAHATIALVLELAGEDGSDAERARADALAPGASASLDGLRDAFHARRGG